MGDLHFSIGSEQELKSKCSDLEKQAKDTTPRSMAPTTPPSTTDPRTPHSARPSWVELPGWLMRRSKNPADWGRAASRAYWRWQFNYILPKKAGLAGPIQLVLGICAFSYAINYNKTYSHHKNFKIQW